jgi:hypothetical protein
VGEDERPQGLVEGSGEPGERKLFVGTERAMARLAELTGELGLYEESRCPSCGAVMPCAHE